MYNLLYRVIMSISDASCLTGTYSRALGGEGSGPLPVFFTRSNDRCSMTLRSADCSVHHWLGYNLTAYLLALASDCGHVPNNLKCDTWQTELGL